MNSTAIQHLIDQLRTGLILPEELTEPEVTAMWAFGWEQMNALPEEIRETLERGNTKAFAGWER